MAEAERLLRQGWRAGRDRRGVPYGFTCPSPRRYKHQWYWDSCFHAIVWRRFVPARARDELRTLVRAGSDDGFVPHTAFWHAPPRWRRAPLYATHSPVGSRATGSTQTPFLALAWEVVAADSHDDPDFAASGLDTLERHYAWLARERDPDGDGLISILLPDESGVDDSPKYDPVFGWMAHHRPGYAWLVTRALRLSWRSRRIMERYPQHVEDVLVNVAYALSLRALARLAGPGRGDMHAEHARRTEQGLLDRCYDDRTGLFFDLAGPDERRVPISTWTSLAPLALSELPEEIRRRLVEDHLLHSRRYRAGTGIPSVALEEPSFRPGFDRFRCWRGASWMATAWLLVPPMRQLGYEEEADEIVASLVDAVSREGFREYYDPLTGSGHGAKDLGMSTLLVELL